MLKRTKGRFLLTVLVITGLAGTLKNSTLTQPERKFAVSYLKETKDELLHTVKGLSVAQLNYTGQDGLSIRNCLDQLAQSEKKGWTQLEAAMKAQSAGSRPETIVPDEELIALAASRPGPIPANKVLHTTKKNRGSTGEAAAAFRTLRTEHIKYTRSTTEDLRNHYIPSFYGQIDAYQLILVISAEGTRYIRQINKIKQEPGFPRQ